MRNRILPAGLALFGGLLFIGPRNAQAWIQAAYPLPADNIVECDKRAQSALARVKGSTPGPLHFSCKAGLVQQLWFSQKSGIGNRWTNFVIENRDLFAPKNAVLKPAETHGGVLRYWRGLKLLNYRISLVSASDRSTFAKHLALGVTDGIISDFPDTRTLTIKTAPKVKAAVARKAAQQLWDKERPGGVLAIKDTELGLYWSAGGNPHLAWVVTGMGKLKEDETPFSFICTVNADTGIPEPQDCSSYGYSL